MKRLIYFCNCLIRPAGYIDPFLVAEWPWLTAHFDRVDAVGELGVAELPREPVEALRFQKTRFAALRAALALPFHGELWAETARLIRSGHAAPGNILRLWRFAWRGLRMYEYAKPLLNGQDDVTLYSNWQSFDGYAAALCHHRRPSMPFVSRGHAFDVDVERTPMNPWLMKRYIAREADGVWLISRTAYEQYMSYMRGHVEESRVHVLPVGSGGMPVDAVQPPPRFANGVMHLVSCAAVLPIKQVPLLVEALAQWQGMPVHWTHIGGGEGFDELCALADEKLSPMEHVVYDLKGPMNGQDVARFYEDHPFDAFINTSRKEGVPVSIMEAMRCGVPAIAPRVGGIPELITPDVGWLYAPEDGVQGILAALRALEGQTRGQADQMRRVARERWERDYCSAALLPRLFQR